MSTPNKGDEAGDKQNNVGEVGGEGSDSQQDTSSGTASSYHSPSNPSPSIDRKARRAELADPPYSPSATDDEITSCWRIEEDARDSVPELSETSGSRKRKRKQGERGRNKWPDNIYQVSDVSPKGEPLLPLPVPAKFRNAIGFLVRDKLDITLPNWKMVTKSTKQMLWNKLKTKFIFQKESRAIAKDYAMKQMAITFRNFRSELVTKFVHKGLDATKKYTNIPRAKWETFVQQKTSEEFLAKSKANSELAKRNIYPHHLGTSGYKGKIPKWREEEEKRLAAGLPKRFENVEDRGASWLLARKPKETESGFVWPDPKTDEAAKRILDLAAKQKEGLFKPSRERDALTIGLGNPEHPGRVRGKSSRLGWKEGFPDDADMYRKRDRYKEALRDFFKDEAKQEVGQILAEIIANPDSEIRQQLVRLLSQLAPTMQQPQMQMAITQTSQLVMASSREQYAVDHILDPSACSLIIQYGITNVRSKVVATGLVFPGRYYNNNPIPEQYCRVQVLTVVEGHRDDFLDIPTPDGAEKLGEAINRDILWPRRDIRLNQPIRLMAEPSLGSNPPEQPNLTSEHRNPTPNTEPSTPPAPEHPNSTSQQTNPTPKEIHSAQPSSTPEQPNPQPTPTSENPTSKEPNNATPDQQCTPEPEPKLKSLPKIVTEALDDTSQLSMKRYLSTMETRPLNVESIKKEKCSDDSALNKLTIRKPCKEDYENVPSNFVLGRPMLPFITLCRSPSMKRLHDWYMRAASAGVNMLSANIPGHTLSFKGDEYPVKKIPFDFEDIWLLFHFIKLDVQVLRLWCLLQISEQQKRFPVEKEQNKKGQQWLAKREQNMIGYLDPQRISEEELRLVVGPNSELFKDLTTDEEKEKAKDKAQLDKYTKVGTYIYRSFLKYKHRRVVCLPYFFRRHWICLFIYLHDARILVFDSADFEESTYRLLINLLNKAYQFYQKNGGLCNDKARNQKFTVQHHLRCHKQPPGSEVCGFYACEFLRQNGRYTMDPGNVLKSNKKNQHLSNDDLVKIGEELCRFILEEVIDSKGKFFDAEGPVLADPQYRELVDIEKLNLKHNDY